MTLKMILKISHKANTHTHTQKLLSFFFNAFYINYFSLTVSVNQKLILNFEPEWICDMKWIKHRIYHVPQTAWPLHGPSHYYSL